MSIPVWFRWVRVMRADLLVVGVENIFQACFLLLVIERVIGDFPIEFTHTMSTLAMECIKRQKKWNFKVPLISLSRRLYVGHEVRIKISGCVSIQSCSRGGTVHHLWPLLPKWHLRNYPTWWMCQWRNLKLLEFKCSHLFILKHMADIL